MKTVSKAGLARSLPRAGLQNVVQGHGGPASSPDAGRGQSEELTGPQVIRRYETEEEGENGGVPPVMFRRPVGPELGGVLSPLGVLLKCRC